MSVKPVCSIVIPAVISAAIPAVNPGRLRGWVAVCLSLWILTLPAVSHGAFKALVDPDGNSVSLSETIGNGKWTLVMLWATDCHLCTEQKPEISAFYDANKDTLANVVGIAIDGPKRLQAVREYLDEHQPTFPNLVSDLRTLRLSYENLTEESFRGTPTYMLFDPDGELKGNNPGPITIPALEKFIARHSN